MVGDYHDFCNDFAAGRLACIEPGVFALVARDKRICTRSIWLGAVADVLILGISSWALVVTIWPEVHTHAGKVGLWFLIITGIGEAMASVFDVTHEVGHGIAGLLGVIGFPIAALLLSVALGRNESWRTARRPLLWLANLSWISVVLLVLTLAIMTMQMTRLNGGHLPQHAPRSLPPGVLALDGWADRLIVLSNCAWVLVAAWHAIQLRRKHS
jgi:hypothetical protein